jgi:hypothetical protein
VLTQNNSARIWRCASIDLHEIQFGRDQSNSAEALSSATGAKIDRIRGDPLIAAPYPAFAKIVLFVALILFVS